ncbi:unnamed protein product, partial [Rotaria magnacalcarata]
MHDMNNSLNEADINDVQRPQTTPSMSTKMINSEAIL